MDLLNVLTVIIFAGALLWGYHKGIIGQLGSLVAVVGALISTRLFGTILEGLMPEEPAFVGPILSSAIVFMIVYLTVMLLARGLKVVTHALMLGPIDRLAGAAFSLFKWFFALSIVVNAWIAVSGRPIENPNRLTQGVIATAPWLWGVATQIYSDESEQSAPSESSNTDTQNL